MKTYHELIEMPEFLDRFNYLKLDGVTCDETFGSKRYLNQILYSSPEWKEIRRKAIIRDSGCDLAFKGRYIFPKILVHHLNPITIEDILQRNPKVFDLDNLVCVSFDTHNAIHYGDSSQLQTIEPVIRKPNDTCPWR